MSRTVPPAALFLAAAILSTLGTARRTKRGAWRIHLGSVRAHLDADGLILWRAGEPRILATLEPTPPEPEPAPELLPKLATDARHYWTPTAHRRPRPFSLVIA
jgi:hypothetical protein